MFTEETKIQILRTLDKHDRVGDEGVRELLTTGRKDESGTFIPGVGLDPAQADYFVYFLNCKGNTNEETIYKITRFMYIMSMPEEELKKLHDTLDKLGLVD